MSDVITGATGSTGVEPVTQSTMVTINSTLMTLAASTDYPMSGGVFYGICTAQQLSEWNYFVFECTEETMTNDKSVTCYYNVHIVHEDYVQEDYTYTVIRALKTAIPGFSVSDDITHNYDTKGNTSMRVEVVTIPFKKARKLDV